MKIICFMTCLLHHFSMSHIWVPNLSSISRTLLQEFHLLSKLYSTINYFSYLCQTSFGPTTKIISILKEFGSSNSLCTTVAIKDVSVIQPKLMKILVEWVIQQNGNITMNVISVFVPPLSPPALWCDIWPKYRYLIFSVLSRPLARQRVWYKRSCVSEYRSSSHLSMNLPFRGSIVFNADLNSSIEFFTRISLEFKEFAAHFSSPSVALWLRDYYKCSVSLTPLFSQTPWI